MAELAINGGLPVRNIKEQPWPAWPIWDESEEHALIDVLNSGVWSYNGPKEKEFNSQFASFIGTQHAICVANGTVTLQIALEALGIGLGDEVIVPGLTWQATAAAVIEVNAIPVLVDVCEDTWCIDPEKIDEAITKKTKAIIPVHLYGGFAEMDVIMEIAQKHNLAVIEDCAHKHGGEWKGKKAGSIGDIGSFSFQLSKHLTAGEGGALTTNNPEIAEKLDALRNCGRRPEVESTSEMDKGAGFYGDDGNFIQSGNFRITEFQSAILVEGLRRLPEQNEVRERNGRYLDTKLSGLPGVKPMKTDKRETMKAYFNYSFRYFKEDFKELEVEKFREALGAELGILVDASYEPLHICPLYVPHTKPARHKLDESYWQAIDPRQIKLPVCERIFKEESVCLHHKVLLGTKADMDDVVAAIQKIYNHIDELV
ncbi:MAG: DegT/DnrJ/EryC1/StrS family aminotransferase [Bacteroidota bacterium]